MEGALLYQVEQILVAQAELAQHHETPVQTPEGPAFSRHHITAPSQSIQVLYPPTPGAAAPACWNLKRIQTSCGKLDLEKTIAFYALYITGC